MKGYNRKDRDGMGIIVLVSMRQYMVIKGRVR